MKKKYFIFTGEASGDLHGSRLIQAIEKKNPEIEFFGVGGPRIRKGKFNSIVNMEQFQVMGFTDVLIALPRLLKLFFYIRNQIILEQPDAVILIDYPGFNLRLAKSLRKKGYQGKIIQYICPTIWAHGKNRLRGLKENFDLILLIYPFEKELLDEHKIHSHYVGNPLQENMKSISYHSHFFDLFAKRENKSIIALFPGSRLQEIKKHIPTQLEVAKKLKNKYPNLIFGISCAHEDLFPVISQYVENSSLQLNKDVWIIPSIYTYDLMKNCHVALAKSGTVSLELALHHKPSVIHYQASFLNYLIARYIIKLKLPFFCIVNILKKEKVFSEYIGKETFVDKIYHEMDDLLVNPEVYEKQIIHCRSIKEMLQDKSSHIEAACAIEALFK